MPGRDHFSTLLGAQAAPQPLGVFLLHIIFLYENQNISAEEAAVLEMSGIDCQAARGLELHFVQEHTIEDERAS